MKLTDLLQHLAQVTTDARQSPTIQAFDAPLAVTAGRHLATVGTLHLYSFDVAADTAETRLPFEDMPISLVCSGDEEPTEGYVVSRQGSTLTIQTFEMVNGPLHAATLIPDGAGFLETAGSRLLAIAAKPERFVLGPAERLAAWVDPQLTESERESRTAAATAVLTTIWTDDLTARRAKLATTAVELARANKRLLVVCRDHRSADDLTGIVARTLRAVNLPYKSLVSRYELAVQPAVAGIPLTELGFEAQMHQFYAKSRSDKAALRKKYERFRELTPLLAYKADKQRDLDEVKHLEWRLLTQISELQGKVKEIDGILAEYEQLPIWKRLAFQTVGKNVQSLPEYREIYTANIRALMAELEAAQRRIEELKPEAAIPKDMRPEYDELKEEITRLGGTKKIRELLTAEEGTNRQAFIQNKRILITTAARVMADPLFSRVRFDALLVDEAPWVPSPYLMAAAALVREKVVLGGDTRDIPPRVDWASPLRMPTPSVASVR